MKDKELKRLSDIHIQLIHAAAACIYMGPSEDPDDWVKGKGVGVKDKRSIQEKSEVLNEKNRAMARRLRSIADDLRPYCDIKPDDGERSEWDHIFDNVPEGTGLYRLWNGNYMPLKAFLKERYHPPKVK